MKRATITLIVTLGLAAHFYSLHIRAADSGFPIYFKDSTLIVTPQTVNRATYLPLVEIVQHLRIPYTDALSLETFTIRAANARLVLTRNSALISVSDQIVLLRNPVLRENDQWLVPIDFLTAGLSRVAGVEFRNRPGAPRMFAGEIDPSELVMNAQALGPLTRLTLRAEEPMRLTVAREAGQNRAVLRIESGPIDPLRERLDVRDRMVNSVAYDDADGTPKILVDTSDLVADVRVTPAEGNRVYFVDFARTAATTSAPATSSTPTVAAPDPGANPAPPRRTVRVIVIDPGHGGEDIGGSIEGALEKDLTLALARRLKSALQNRLGVTVLLTRDSDIGLTNEARSAVANNNQANLFISLHVGYSNNKLDSGSSVYVMKEDFAVKFSPATSRDRLFLPWYMGYRSSRNESQRMARIVQDELSKALPGWKFPLRNGPIAVLASATMPAISLEIGNLNNSVNVQTLQDASFQGRLASTVAAAVERFAAAAPASGY